MSDDGKLVLYDLDGNVAGSAGLVEGEVVFADKKFRWTWVLDARHEPYTSLPLKDVLHRADHARKQWVLSVERSA